jgi:hypothetical protein
VQIANLHQLLPAFIAYSIQLLINIRLSMAKKLVSMLAKPVVLKFLISPYAYWGKPEELGDGLGLLDGLADIQFDCLGKGKVEKR